MLYTTGTISLGFERHTSAAVISGLKRGVRKRTLGWHRPCSHLALTGVLGLKNSYVTRAAYHETAVMVHRPGNREDNTNDPVNRNWGPNYTLHSCSRIGSYHENILLNQTRDPPSAAFSQLSGMF